MRLTRFIGLIGCMSLLAACSDVQLFGLDPENYTEVLNHDGPAKELFVCDGVDRDFATDVLGVFEARCVDGCHQGVNATGIGNSRLDLDITDGLRAVTPGAMIGYLKRLERQKNLINTGTPFNSKILARPLAQSANGDFHSLDVFENTKDPDYKKIRCWIEDGAPDTASGSECGFGAVVWPIITAGMNCTNGCHVANNPGGPAGGFSLDKNLNSDEVYNQLMTSQNNNTAETTKRVDTANPAKSGILYYPLGNPLPSGVDHPGGFTNKMGNGPRYQNFLCWINEGAQNN